MPAPLKTFIIYARADEAFKSQLLRHLRPLRSVAVWHDGNILPGEEWGAAIKRELKASELVLFLVSADSLNSDYIQSKELQTALDLLQQGQARLVPIVVAPCAWKFDPIISGLQALPAYRGEGVRPVRSWPDPDEAWTSVVEHLGEMVTEIQKQREATTEAGEQQRREAEARAEREKAETLAARQAAERDAALRRERKQAEAQAAQAAQQEAERRRRLAEEQAKRDHEAFAAAAASDTVASYDEYLRNFPAGAHETEARQRRKEAIRRERAGAPVGYFSVRNIAIGLVLLVLGIWGVSYFLKNDPPKQDNLTQEDPKKADSLAAANAKNPQTQEPLPGGGVPVESQKQPQTVAQNPQTTTQTPPQNEPTSAMRKFIEPAMANIPAGSFQMGSNAAEAGSDEKPVHTVTIRAFQLGKTEVTFEEYDLFCEATSRKKPEDEGWGRGKHPVINVSWDDAKAYCAWLSKMSGKSYRLPSEAEWEYAARGGRNTQYSYSGSNDIGEVAWYGSNSGSKTHPVGGKKANELGLFDMSGNVWEWCEDWYHDSYNGAPANGSAWLSPAGSFRVLRGGSWYDDPQHCRAAYRDDYSPGDRGRSIGFRLARAVSF